MELPRQIINPLGVIITPVKREEILEDCRIDARERAEWKAMEQPTPPIFSEATLPADVRDRIQTRYEVAKKAAAAYWATKD